MAKIQAQRDTKMQEKKAQGEISIVKAQQGHRNSRLSEVVMSCDFHKEEVIKNRKKRKKKKSRQEISH